MILFLFTILRFILRNFPFPSAYFEIKLPAESRANAAPTRCACPRPTSSVRRTEDQSFAAASVRLRGWFVYRAPLCSTERSVCVVSCVSRLLARCARLVLPRWRVTDVIVLPFLLHDSSTWRCAVMPRRSISWRRQRSGEVTATSWSSDDGDEDDDSGGS